MAEGLAHDRRSPSGIAPTRVRQVLDRPLGLTIDPAATAVTVAPTTWMASVGWQRAGGPLKPQEHPSASPRPHPA